MIVVRKSRDEAMNRLMHRLRTRPHLESVWHRNAAPRVLRHMRRRQGYTAFLVDHNCNRHEAIFLPFLGREAAVNKGPAVLAVRGGAIVAPLYLLRADAGKYVAHIDEPLDTAELSGEREEKVEQVARYYTAMAEKWVRVAPEQWYWMHKRWKTRPPEETENS